MKDAILLGAFTAVESAHAYSAFLPSIFTIRTFGQQPDTLQSIRDGEMIGTIFALALGGVVSALTDSAIPIIFGAITAAFMVAVYEWALRTRNGG